MKVIYGRTHGEACGLVCRHLQAGRPQAVPAQLSHLYQEVFLELHSVRRAEFV